MSMVSINEIFDVTLSELDNGETVHFINIEDINDNLKTLIDDHIVEICGADLETLTRTKKVLNDFFTTKDERTQMGALAEFMVHLYLKKVGFKQECLFLNLEEGSIKKGFDGYYSYSSEEWIMESKSGKISTEGITHNKKIKAAYKDLEEKIDGRSSNNPWKNAFSHAKVVGSSEDILENIKTLSNMYIDEEYPTLSSLNIIPASTIFQEETWIDENIERETSSIEAAITQKEYKGLHVICINKKSLVLIKNYLTN